MPPPAFGGVRCPARGVAAVRWYLCASVPLSGLVLATARFHRPAVLSVSLLCCGRAPAKAPCPLPLVGAVALAVATLRLSLRSPVAGPQFPRSLNPRSLWSRPSGFGESGIGLRPRLSVGYANGGKRGLCCLRHHGGGGVCWRWHPTKAALQAPSSPMESRLCGVAGARPRRLQSCRYAPGCASFRRHDPLRFTLD